MEESMLLKAEIREQIGSKWAGRTRKAGKVPAVVYGHKKTPQAIAVDAHDFLEGLHHGHRLMDIEIDGKKQKIIVKDVQYDYLGKDIIHADLMRVDVTERIKVTVRVELKGTAHGTTEGGIIEEHADRLEVECLVMAIPETLVILVTDVGVGDNLHASDVELPEGVKLISSPDTLLVTCAVVGAAKSSEELEEEAPATPEVIGEVAEEAAGGEAEKS